MDKAALPLGSAPEKSLPMFTIATGTSIPVRLREALVARLLTEEAPDILCLQEIKSIDKFPVEGLLRHLAIAISWRGQRAIMAWRSCRSCRWGGCGRAGPCRSWPCPPPCRGSAGEWRHHPQLLCSRPAATFPDREQNEKFGQKLDFLTDARCLPRRGPGPRDLSAISTSLPREDDVWSHKQLLEDREPHPVEVEHLAAAQDAGKWVDITRQDIPEAALQLVELSRQDWDAADKTGVWITSGPRPISPAPGMAAASCAPRARLGPAQRSRSGSGQLRPLDGAPYRRGRPCIAAVADPSRE